MKAWRVQIPDFEDGICHAKNRAQAKYRTWKCANDVGYRLQFDDIRAIRCKEWDDFPPDQEINHPVLENYLRTYKETNYV